MRNSTAVFSDRWTARRKANVVATVKKNHLTAREARLRWGVTEEELARWVLKEQGFLSVGQRVHGKRLNISWPGTIYSRCQKYAPLRAIAH